MKADELKGKTIDELSKMLLDLKKEQVNQRFQKAAGQLEKTSEIRKVRRDIARLKTAQTQVKSGKAAPAKKGTTAKPKKKAAA
jgi:large subunit ribosomal protein L29